MTSSTFVMTCAAALSQKLSYNKGRSGFQHLRGEILSKRLVLSIARHPLAANLTLLDRTSRQTYR